MTDSVPVLDIRPVVCIVGHYNAQRERDLKPCARCGGDTLRADFRRSEFCHVQPEGAS